MQNYDFMAREFADTDSFQYPKRILMIDDDLLQQLLIREMLGRQGICCDCCDHVSKAMRQLRDEQYDLLITDIQLPDINGFDLPGILRSSDIPQANVISILAITARIDIDEPEYIARGFTGCLYKPFTLLALITAMTGEDCLREHGEEVSFSTLFRGEEYRTEILELFIHETRKDMSALCNAAQSEDTNTVSDILHKIHPLWIALGLNLPSHLSTQNIPAILRTGEWLVRRAIRLHHSITKKADAYGPNPDRRG